MIERGRWLIRPTEEAGKIIQCDRDQVADREAGRELRSGRPLNENFPMI